MEVMGVSENTTPHSKTDVDTPDGKKGRRQAQRDAGPSTEVSKLGILERRDIHYSVEGRDGRRTLQGLSERARPGKILTSTSEKGLDLCNNRFKTAKEDVLNSYEKWADAYEYDSMEKLGFNSPRMCVETFLKYCGAGLYSKNVLDIGAGTGLLGQMVRSQGYQAHTFDAMDLSPKMLEHLVKKGVYTRVEAWDMMKYPWPFPSNHYEGSMCNGVLIYVDDPECLDEFVRITKPGGLCVIMFRHDGYPLFEAKDLQLRAAGRWELVHKTPDARNFTTVNFGENPEDDVIFNQYVFRVLEDSPAQA